MAKYGYVHAIKKKGRAFLFREFDLVSDEYITPSLNEEEIKLYLISGNLNFGSFYLLEIENIIERAKKQGTSELGRERSLSRWQSKDNFHLKKSKKTFLEEIVISLNNSSYEIIKSELNDIVNFNKRFPYINFCIGASGLLRILNKYTRR